MRAVMQRVKKASVTDAETGELYAEIGKGALVLIGIGEGDTRGDADDLIDSVINLRIFPDEEGKMNLSLLDIEGNLLLVPQFTLYGDCRRGRRPSFTGAAEPQTARRLYQYFVDKASKTDLRVSSGCFAAHMEVELTNDGPVTMLIDSDRIF